MVNFWDTSATVPLCYREPSTPRMLIVAEDDPSLVVWWGTRTECISAFARYAREGHEEPVRRARQRLDNLSADWFEIEPSERLRSTAERLLAIHVLRAAEAFQLAAALQWCEGQPLDHGFVCLDARLRRAAEAEGFAIRPVAGG